MTRWNEISYTCNLIDASTIQFQGDYFNECGRWYIWWRNKYDSCRIVIKEELELYTFTRETGTDFSSSNYLIMKLILGIRREEIEYRYGTGKPRITS